MIERAVKECPHSLFIIDEMDKMPPGVIDSLKPYLDFYEQLGGVDYRKATFFFLRYSKCIKYNVGIKIVGRFLNLHHFLET